MTALTADQLRLMRDLLGSYADGRDEAREERGTSDMTYPVIARRNAMEFAARAADPGCWEPEAVAGTAAYWFGYADEMETEQP